MMSTAARRLAKTRTMVTSTLPSAVIQPAAIESPRGAYRRPPTDRRSKVRYDIRLTVRYRLVGRKLMICGNGETTNISSSGALVLCEHKLIAGSRLELRIDWPYLLDLKIPLQLVTAGQVVRSLSSGFAVSFYRYEFRTVRRKAVAAAPLKEPGGIGSALCPPLAASPL